MAIRLRMSGSHPVAQRLVSLENFRKSVDNPYVRRGVNCTLSLSSALSLSFI